MRVKYDLDLKLKTVVEAGWHERVTVGGPRHRERDLGAQSAARLCRARRAGRSSDYRGAQHDARGCDGAAARCVRRFSSHFGHCGRHFADAQSKWSAAATEAATVVGSEVDAVRRERVLELLRNKVSASKIVREVWGVSGGMPINGRRVSSAKWSRRSWRRWMRDFSTTRGEARSIHLVLIERAPFSPNVIAVLYFANETSCHFRAVDFGRRLFV